MRMRPKLECATRLANCEFLETRRLLAVTFADRAVLDTPGNALVSERVGNLVYIADQDSGISVFDVSTPALPVLRATFQTTSAALDLTIRDNLAYVGLARGMQILDISNLQNIRSVGAFDTADNVRAIEVRDSIAYLGAGTSLALVSVANPAVPTLLARLTNIGANQIDLVGNVAYAADGTRGLRAVDVRNPLSPQLVSTTLAGFDVVDLAQQGGFLYAATRNNGISTYSIAANPGNPVLLSQSAVLSNQSIRSMDIAGPNLFVGTTNSLIVLDARTSSLASIGEFALPFAVVSDVSVGGGSILVSTGAPGVRLIEARDDVGAISGGILQVLGTASGDNISVIRTSDTLITLQRNGIIERVAVAGVFNGIRVNAVGGADVVTISNLAINTTIGGGSGQDTITTSDGRDSINGGKGGDRISTAGNADTVFGDEGLDSILGGSGDDYLSGGAGADTLQGGVGNDALEGGDDNDSIIGGDGNDTLYGQAGDDILIGKGGADLYFTNPGRNTVLAQDGIADTIYASTALDVLSLDPIDVLLS